MISIIVPVKNDVTMLQEFIDNLRSQSYNDYELIVVDGGSRDGSQTYATCSYVLPPDERSLNFSVVAAQRNYGAKQARGDILIHTDCDIRFTDSNQLERIARVASRTGFALGSPKLSGHNGRCREVLRRCFVPIMSSMMIVRSNVFHSVGGFQERRWHDFHLHLDCRRLGYKPILLNEKIQHLRPFSGTPFLLKPFVG